jgi:flagellum-specific peptidoglycan hydrolase FlgJ
MGRTKWYSEPESNNQQPFNRQQSGSAKTRKNGLIVRNEAKFRGETAANQDLFKALLTNIRRYLHALRFRIKQITFGLFRKHTVLKLGFACVAGYLLLFYEKEPQTASVASGNPEPVHTRLEFAAPKGISKPARVKPKKNEAAPVVPTEAEDDQTKAYINRFSKIARTEMNKYGVPASISLAQGLIESRAGTSKLARNNNNHFGMKCFLKNCKTGHCSNYSDDSHKDFFRIFKNPWDSWNAHSQMISTGRYAKLKRYGHDYKRWAQGLKSVGYATDHSYADKLIGVIEKHQLYRYDR